MKKTNLKNNKGITLIALVVTIIILLILAAITISILTNSNLITRAEEAVDRTKDSSKNEKLQLAIADAKMDDLKNFSVTEESLKKSLSNYFGDDATVTSNSDGSFKVGISEDNGNNQEIYTVENDGQITAGEYDKWDGTTSTEPTDKKENEIHITTTEELKWLADQVNGGTTFEGYKIYLDNNLDLGAKPDVNNWETIENESKKWTPIGGGTNGKSLKGEFLGNNHIVKGLYVNSDASNVGLFGNATSVKDLTVKNGYVKGAAFAAGVTGVIASSGTIENCSNINVTVKADSMIAGGVVGIAYPSATVKNCLNSADMPDGTTYIGGVVGYAHNSSKILSCKNTGNITVTSDIGGGVAGVLMPGASMEDCENEGIITGYNQVGAIVGSAAGPNTISNCKNSKTVIANDYVGGILGYGQSDINLNNCKNSGSITGNDNVAGITGMAVGTITKCENTGSVLGKSTDSGTCIAGIVGTCIGGGHQEISQCYNSGTITAVTGAGGISGYLGARTKASEEKECYNKGKIVITGEPANRAGELIAICSDDAKVENNYYLIQDGNKQAIGVINSGDETPVKTLDEISVGTKAITNNFSNLDDFLNNLSKIK